MRMESSYLVRVSFRLAVRQQAPDLLRSNVEASVVKGRQRGKQREKGRPVVGQRYCMIDTRPSKDMFQVPAENAKPPSMRGA